MFDRGLASSLTICVALMMSACSGAADEPLLDPAPSAEAPTESSTPTESPEPTESATRDSSDDDDDSGPSDDSRTDGGSDGTATQGPDTVPTDLADTPLGLDEAFAATQGWEESRFEIADRSDVAGMGVNVRTCRDDDNAAQLEYRLANRFDTLTFSVGQGNRSPSSDQQLSVRILGNEDQLEIQKVPFNEITTIAVPVNGVNALKIRLFLDDEDQRCEFDSQVTAIIHDLTVE